MKVSIITPCYNSAKTIRQTIESVLNQTYNNIEYIVVDGGSTDNTINIINEYIPLFHGRLRYVSQKDNGIYDAMNKGIKMSHGQIIGIINSDDYYEIDAVESIVSKFDSKKMQVIYGYMNIIRNNGTKKVLIIPHTKLKERMINHSTCFVSRKIYQKYGLFNIHFKIAADYDLMLRLSKKKDVEFIQIPKILADFREGGVSSSYKTQLEKKFIQVRYGGISISDFFTFLIEYIYKYGR